MNVLVQFDPGRPWNEAESLGVELHGSFLNYHPGIYVIDFDGDYSDLTGDSTLDSGFISLGEEVIEIGSIKVDTEIRLTRVDTFEELAEEASFYNDLANRRCYFRLQNYDTADSKLIEIGIPVYVSTKELYDGLTPYDPYLQNSITTVDSRDKLVDGIFEYNSFNLELQNKIDYDNFNLINQQVRIFSFDGTTKESIYTGYIESATETVRSIGISVQDDRKKFDAPILKNKLTLSQYNNLSEKLDGEFIPLRLGNNIQVKALCLNGEEFGKGDSGTYEFIVTDPLYGSVQSIANATENGAPITIASTDLNACTFTISKSSGETIAIDNILVDVNSYAGLSNGADLIQWLFENIQGIQYTDRRFNTTEWEATKLNMYNSFVNIKEQTSVIEAVEQLAKSNLVLFAVEPDSRLTLRVEDLNATPVGTIPYQRFDDYLNVSITDDNSDVYNEVSITYNGGKIVSKIDNKAQKLYSAKKSLELEYSIETDADAETVAERVLELTSTRRDKLSLSFIDKNNDFAAVKANDIVNVEIPWRGTVKALCLTVQRQVDTGIIAIDGAIIEG